MKPYSHLIIAAELEDEIRPKVLEDYYWGAVAPDVRFTAGIARQGTHLTPEEILGFRIKYPHLKSFVQGYLIHCLADSVDTRALLHQRVFLRPLLKQASNQFISTMIEVFHIENSQTRKPVSGRPNEILTNLGILPKNVETEVKVLIPYLNKPDFATNLAYVKSGPNSGLQPYVKELEKIETNLLVKPLWFWFANFNHLQRQLISRIRVHSAFKDICE